MEQEREEKMEEEKNLLMKKALEEKREVNSERKFEVLSKHF